ncbi:MAG: hypothetical protein JSU63_16750 [Phycisphaerales bacterium]|nr:MAG: hypothetical protein JSU63_16750 [Phycisphaerales bacterium]
MSTGDSGQLAEAHHGDGVKETIESIVIALILAFVFRAFVVEAFVIPTGSMAPTLYGAHGTIVCDDCGTEFAYGLRDLKDTRRSTSVSSNAKAVCPNCSHPNTRLTINDIQRNPETGDRILVLKWPFDFGGDLLGPARWDVVVFKDPADAKTNFIKRLVGLPNEVLMILHGDLYAAPVSELSDETLAELDEGRRGKYLRRTGQTEERLEPVSMRVREELDEKVRIVRKPAEAQEALWFTVYDHDYPPQLLDSGQPHWRAILGDSSGWDTSSRRIRYENRTGREDYIELWGKQIRADCAYNIHPRSKPPMVADQRVRFVLTPLSNTGSVTVRVGSTLRPFDGMIRMDGLVMLSNPPDMWKKQDVITIGTQLPPLALNKPVEISVEHVDYRASIRIGGKEVLATSSDPSEEGYYAPDVRQLRQEAQSRAAVQPRVYATNGVLEITHLAVDRDEYYYHVQGGGLALRWAPRAGWASPISPILLREDEHFMLGDNTAASKDSRLWDTVAESLDARGEDMQLGTVPRDQLIGKAFFVYWPSPNRVSWLQWLPVVKGSVIPDVGRMRWIR